MNYREGRKRLTWISKNRYAILGEKKNRPGTASIITVYCRTKCLACGRTCFQKERDFRNKNNSFCDASCAYRYRYKLTGNNKERDKRITLDKLLITLKDHKVIEISIPYIPSFTTREELINEITTRIMERYNKNPAYYGKRTLGFWLKKTQWMFYDICRKYEKDSDMPTGNVIFDIQEAICGGVEMDNNRLIMEDFETIMTIKEMQILKMRLAGYKFKEIAKKIGVSRTSVTKYYKVIKDKVRELYGLSNTKS